MRFRKTGQNKQKTTFQSKNTENICKKEKSLGAKKMHPQLPLSLLCISHLLLDIQYVINYDLYAQGDSQWEKIIFLCKECQ